MKDLLLDFYSGWGAKVLIGSFLLIFLLIGTPIGAYAKLSKTGVYKPEEKYYPPPEPISDQAQQILDYLGPAMYVVGVVCVLLISGYVAYRLILHKMK